MMLCCWNVSRSRGPAAQYKNCIFVHTTATNRSVSLSWGSSCSPSWRTHCHWDRSGGSCMSSCVIVFSACVWHISMRHYQCVENFISVGFTLTSLRICFPFFRWGWWHLHAKLLLIWKREWQRDKQRKRGGYCLIWLVTLTCCETLDAIRLFVLNCPVTGILSFFREEIIINLFFLSTLAEPLYNTQLF